MKQNTLETVVGAIVLIVAAYFLYFALHNREHDKSGTYELLAQFSDVEGLAPGSMVRISGVKVGTVSKISLDPKTYLAMVHMALEDSVAIPSDTLATVASPGLLGDKYMSLEPGSAEDMLKPGGVITDTQSAASLEKLLGQVIFSLQNVGKASSAAPAPGEAPAAPK